MSTKLLRLFEEIASENFDRDITVPETQPVKLLFQSRAFQVSSAAVQEDHNNTYAKFAFSETHTRYAMQNVCQAVMDHFRNNNNNNNNEAIEISNEEEERLTWKFLTWALRKEESLFNVMDAALVKSAIDFHYSTARPRQFDMFVHLSASEMFFIDGDSLLMAAMSFPQVDWDLMQPVHVIFNAQLILKRLQEQGARFHVVFFDQQKWFWEKAPQKFFIRECFRISLTNMSITNESLIVKNFDCYHGEDFKQYCTQVDPEFILLSDGEQLGKLNELHQMYQGDATYRSVVEDEAHGERVSLYYRTFILWTTSQRIKVVYSSRIVPKENAMIVFAMTVDSYVFARALMLKNKTVELAAQLESSVSLPELSAGSLEVSKNTVLTLPERVVGTAVRAFMDANPSANDLTKQLCQAFVFSAYCIPLLSVRHRAQPVAPSAEVQTFLNTLSPYLLSSFLVVGCKGSKEVDLWDGHLLGAIVHHCQSTAPSALLDADGVGELEDSWKTIAGEAAGSFLNAPLTALPTVNFHRLVKTIKYPHFTHELVDRLAQSFEVRTHSSDVPFPKTFGLANNLKGWAVAHPLDELDDVVDSYEETEKQKNMTEKDKKLKEKLNAAYVADAITQAKSMDITFAEPITMVVSEDDEEEDTEEDAEKGEKALLRKKIQERQRNKKGRSKEDIIREEKNLNEANRSVRDAAQQVKNVLQSTSNLTGKSKDDRRQYILTIDALLARFKRGQSFGSRFDPGFSLTETTEHDIPIDVFTWRKLVECSDMSEVEFVYSLDGKGGKAAAANNNNKSLLFGLQLIQELVDTHVANKAKNNKGVNDAVKEDWGPLDRLRQTEGNPLSTTADVVRYLTFIYLTYVQTHFEARLMCRTAQMLLEDWKEERERARMTKEEINVSVGVPLFIYCHQKVLGVVRDTGVCLAETDMDIIRSALAHFDFAPDYYEKVDSAITRWQGRKPSSLPFSMRPREKIQQETPEIMQLTHMGHLFERPIIAQKDYRVVFNPDGWQRDLLDIVDQRGSAVVCAPTSAGKTFISYYCMLNTLRTSNTRVVLYVAPNRALINQAVADVCGRYGSKQYRSSGFSAYGVHGGHDYHRFYDKCQVLVLLPEVLETMLTSPKYKEWTKKLDYAILDEIHTMESSGNGDVWERVLALLPCPFVALSATLGETQQLCGWLNRVQGQLQKQEEAEPEVKRRRRDYTVHDIPRTGAIQRWNDIKKYIYLPPPGFVAPLKKLTTAYKERHIQDLHPLSILSIDQLRDGFPPDISLVPSEVVQLYQRMLEFFQRTITPEGSEWTSLSIVGDLTAQLNYLKPEVYFAKANYITQSAARQYEVEVKKAFVYWTVLGQKPMAHFRNGNKEDVLTDAKAIEFSAVMLKMCNEVLQSFSQHLYAEEVKLEEYAIAAATKRGEELQSASAAEGNNNSKTTAAQKAAPAAHFPDSKEFIVANIINVLRELKARDMGPTIVFSFESEDCDDLVKNVVEQLEYAEQLYRETDEFANYKANMERKQAAQKAAQKQKESNLKQKRSKDDDDEKEAPDMMEEDTEDYTIPDVLPEFTFIGSGNMWEKEREVVAACEASGEPLLARAIKRGIGIHHAGVKGKLRRLNEILFRGRHCGVVFATETLALGVHSPCRSVVLAGDHVLLDTTQFRQMMGRAGRRGLDFLGHLVLLSISMKKITRLMTSSMTVIKGNVQVTPITQLRLLQLYDFAEHREAGGKKGKAVEECKKHATRLAERLLVNPLFFRGREASAEGNMEPFSIELFQMLLGFLQRQGLHFHDRPSSLGVLLVNAMYTFRSAGVGVEGFALLSMLVRGVFQFADFPEALAARLNTSVYPAEPDQDSCSEALAELMAYLLTVHKTTGIPLEIHRSALSDPIVRGLWSAKRSGVRQHRVVLAPLHQCVSRTTESPLDNTSAFRVISAFYAFLAERLPSLDQLDTEGHQLPFMYTKKNFIFAKKDGDEISMPIMEKLKQTAQPFLARDAFVAVSGCGDDFMGVEDLVWTLRKGLLCDRQLLPLLDFTDGCRHDRSQILVNACVADFARCQAQIDSIRNNYRFTRLEELNGLTQSESFAVLSRVELLLSNLAGLFRHDPFPPMKVLEALFPGEEEDEEEETEPQTGDYYYAGAKRLLSFADHFHKLRSQIDKDYSGDQMRKARQEAIIRRQTEKKK